MATLPLVDSGSPTQNVITLQALIDSASAGDIITLPRPLTPGTVIFRGRVVLRAKTGVVTIRPAGFVDLPIAGTRITPGTATRLPLFEPAANNTPAICTVNAPEVAQHWRLELLEIRAQSYGGGSLVLLGSNDRSLAASQQQSTLSLVPSDITLDRCYIHGLPASGQLHGIGDHARGTTVTECYISDCWGVGQDTQAYFSANGPGGTLLHNSYLEGAGENVIWGGDDPIIPNLIPTGVTITRCDFPKPLSWRDPILATPTGVLVQAAVGGGTLTGSHTYVVVARQTIGQGNVARSTPATPVVSANLATAGRRTILWNAQPLATAGFFVYNTTTGQRYSAPAGATSLIDTGAAGTAAVAPTTPGSIRTVKNSFEIKNGDGFLVRGCRFDYLWADAQNGYAISLKSVNQGGRAPWSVVKNITIEYCRIRHVGAPFLTSAYDAANPEHVSGRATNIHVRHCLIEDAGGDWRRRASTGDVLSLREALTTTGTLGVNPTEGVDGWQFDHCTTLGTSLGASVYFSGILNGVKAQCPNFKYTNSFTRFGIWGETTTEGLPTLTAWAPGAVVTKNGFVGRAAGLYPAGNFFPTEAAFQAQFVNYAGGDYTVAPTSPYYLAGTDGLSIGADIAGIAAAYAGATTPPDCTYTLNSASANVPAAGGGVNVTVTTTPTCQWTASSGAAWITLVTGGTGTGSGAVGLSVAANPSTSSRIGTVTIAGTSFPVLQAGQAIPPPTGNTGPGYGWGGITVTSPGKGHGSAGAAVGTGGQVH